MGLVDLFSSEDRVEVKFSDFYNLIKESTKAELILNAVNCNVPHSHIREMATGKIDKKIDFRTEEILGFDHTKYREALLGKADIHTDMTIHIKPIIFGVDVGSGEDETPFPRETPGEEESTQEPQIEANCGRCRNREKSKMCNKCVNGSKFVLDKAFNWTEEEKQKCMEETEPLPPEALAEEAGDVADINKAESEG